MLLSLHLSTSISRSPEASSHPSLSEETPTQTFPYPSIADSLSDLQTEGGKRCLRRSRWIYFLLELFAEAALLIWELGGIRWMRSGIGRLNERDGGVPAGLGVLGGDLGLVLRIRFFFWPGGFPPSVSVICFHGFSFCEIVRVVCANRWKEWF